MAAVWYLQEKTVEVGKREPLLAKGKLQHFHALFTCEQGNTDPSQNGCHLTRARAKTLSLPSQLHPSIFYIAFLSAKPCSPLLLVIYAILEGSDNPPGEPIRPAKNSTWFPRAPSDKRSAT